MSCYDGEHERHPGSHLPRRAAGQDHDPAHQSRTHSRRHESAKRPSRALPPGENLARQRLRECRHRRRRARPRVREREARRAFDSEFIELARAVYIANDERAAIKKRVNLQLGSRIVEEKSYKPY
jgi:hypothetical protein